MPKVLCAEHGSQGTLIFEGFLQATELGLASCLSDHAVVSLPIWFAGFEQVVLGYGSQGRVANEGSLHGWSVPYNFTVIMIQYEKQTPSLCV